MTERKINFYTCPSEHRTVTVDVDEGVTPFMIVCRTTGCTDVARSAFYDVDQGLKPEWEWYKPDDQEMARLRRRNRRSYDHARRDGLRLRRVTA